MARSVRTGCRTVLGAVAVLVGLLVAREVYIAVTATPGSAVDYHAGIVELVEASQPGGRDGWDDLVQALDSVKRVTDEFDVRLWSDAFAIIRDPHVWNEEDFEHTYAELLQGTRSMLDRMGEEGAWDALGRVAASPRAVRPLSRDDGALVVLLLPELGRMRHAARALAARMYLAHRAGRDDEAAEAFEQGMALARVASSQWTLIDHMVGISVSVLMVTELHRELIERPHDEAALRRMLEALDRQLKPHLTLAIEGERLRAMETIQWTHTDDGNGDGRLILTQLDQLDILLGRRTSYGGWRIVNAASIAFPSKKETVRLADQYFDALVSRAALTFSQREVAPAHPILRLNGIPARQMVLRGLLPAASRAMDAADACETALGGGRLALVIELYRLEHGSYPASLDDLVPSVLSALPQDPLARDGRFGYKLVEDSARAYLLYSSGRDGEDNGGRFDPDADMRPSLQGDGFDVMLNMPRTPEEEYGEDGENG